ncbi:mechanosensitive ion channel family protein [Aliidiomarina sp.]|uniref:mechanosensitive ion channel family protein n=1 Tax=Aliidiomarina sp. TaxID=1872439 RepID=UPI003A4E1E46
MEHVLSTLQQVFSMQTLPEWAVLLVAILIGMITRRRLIQKLGDRGSQSKGLRQFAIRSIERLAWPMSMLLVVWLGQIALASLQTTPILDVAVALLFSFAAIRFIVYFLRKSIKGGPLLKASESFIAATIWIIVGMHLLGVLPQAMAALDSVGTNIGDFRLSVLSGLKLLVLILIALTISGWITHLIESRLAETKALNASTRVGLIKFIKFAVVTIAVVIVLSSVGFDLSTFAVFGGALGVGLGFGLQRIAANFISGFIVIMDRSIKPGDVVTIGTEFGWVKELKARYIVLRNRSGVDTLIPNENLITSNVINWSYSDREVRMTVNVDISYDNDPEQAIELMLPCAFASERVLQTPVPNAWLTDFGDNGITLELRFWISDPENGFESVRSAIRMAIWKTFKEHGITIPYPQRDLHLKSVSPEVLEQLQAQR